MALPSTGEISLGQIQTEFGGSNPISINEYYRDGYGYTTVEKNDGVRYTGPLSGSPLTPLSTGCRSNSTVGRDFFWDGTKVGNNPSMGTTLVVGIYTYRASSYKYADGTYTYESIYRTWYINQTVPDSGTISLDNFHGTYL